MTRRLRTRRGSVILLVIGLLTIIAMLGSMLLLVARLDKQTSQAIATVAPEYHVAEGIVARLCSDRLDDLYINSSGVVYGNLSGDLRRTIDYPAAGYDDALAYIEPTEVSPGVWRWLHVSHLPGTVLRNPNDPNGPPLSADNVPVNDPSAVDTDGDQVRDSFLFATGVMNRDGKEYYAAVRMIDAAGLLNVNTASEYTRPANWNQTMLPMDVALTGLLTQAEASNISSLRGTTGPYDSGDMLAASWRGDPNNDPNTVVGRLAGAAGAGFLAARGTLTTASACGTLSPVWTYWGGAGQGRVDPNTVDVQTAYKAFLAVLNSQRQGDPENPRKAAQLAVNLLDYTDVDGSPTPFISPVGNVYGIERHPFITKIFIKRRFQVGTGELPPICAVELYNPYANTILLDNYRLLISGNPVQLTGLQIDGGNRFVAYNDPAVQIDSSVPDNSRILEGSLDTRYEVKLLWQPPSQSWGVCVDQTTVFTEAECGTPDAGTQARWRARYRDDRSEYACYSLANYIIDSPGLDTNTAYDYTLTRAMGEANPVEVLPTPPPMAPCPVFVRNGPMISLGDMMRLFTVGPTETDGLPLVLANTNENDRQLLPAAPVSAGAFPAVPAGCVVSEFFNLVPADSGGNISGLVNINTAPRAVLQCLPPFSRLAQADRDALTSEIIAYRDHLNNASNGGFDYSVDRSISGINNLREQPGFACSGEVALPLFLRFPTVPGVAAELDMYGPLPPRNYALGISPTNDDGITVNSNNQAVSGAQVMRHALYTWLANQVTVRSNTYIAYIRVQVGDRPESTSALRYVAVIDRGNCTTANTQPRVLMLTDLR